ncbi:MAG: NmrA family NAD(P)-binding protein [Prochloraceae cyanobacterium]|nr:NmrA family NAD(P)-binding protein [Prochloraceae cyanobacterium]
MLKPKILVTTAAGKTGFATAMQLLEAEYPVRAFVRRRNARAMVLEQAGAELFMGDMANIADLNRSLIGVQRAYFCAPPAPNMLFHSMAFAVAAQDAKLEVVVGMSQWLSHPQHPAFATRETWLTDRILSWMPDVDSVIVNPGWFADNYMMVLEPIAQLGIMPLPLGEGLNPPPSNEDIARVIVGALTNPAPHIGKTYRPTGSQLLSPQEIAAIYSKVLKRPVKYTNISEKMFLKAISARGVSKFFQSQIRYYAEEYRRNAFGLGGVTNAVKEVAGREPEDFETITRRYVTQRAEAKLSLTNKLKAVRNFVQIILTPVPDLDKYERDYNYPAIAKSAYAPDFNSWMNTHSVEGAFGRSF